MSGDYTKDTEGARCHAATKDFVENQMLLDLQVGLF